MLNKYINILWLKFIEHYSPTTTLSYIIFLYSICSIDLQLILVSYLRLIINLISRHVQMRIPRILDSFPFDLTPRSTVRTRTSSDVTSPLITREKNQLEPFAIRDYQETQTRSTDGQRIILLRADTERHFSADGKFVRADCRRKLDRCVNVRGSKCTETREVYR